ncbi:MAG TPA: hypothetical protein VMI31_15170 [Fimbriimonadaceae bacterium]|nr:hypothetical protein [Fimbriimonadaceae bacterium]
MRVLSVPNWSFGRDSDLLSRFRETLEERELTIHYLQSDVDHNRTVSAFSGAGDAVFGAVEQLCELAFDRIDLNHHSGVHPRIGALDVCPFLPLPDLSYTSPATSALPGPAQPESTTPASPSPIPQPSRTDSLLADVENFSAKIADRFQLPIFLYEKSERGRHEADLPSLRRGGFGGLLERELNPDFGPRRANPQLGVAVVGVRDFLIAVNVNLGIEDPTIAKAIATEIRGLRASGDHRFLGVRALGFPLASQHRSQVSVNLTLPDITSVDPVVEWIMAEAASRKIRFVNTELIGVIRRHDVANASRLVMREAQIVDV